MKPVVVKAMTFDEIIAEADRREQELEAKLAKMTPEERAAWEENERRLDAEAEKLLNQLRRSPGFFEFKI